MQRTSHTTVVENVAGLEIIDIWVPLQLLKRSLVGINLLYRPCVNIEVVDSIFGEVINL